MKTDEYLTIEATLTAHSLSVRYPREKDTDKNCCDNMEKWSKFVVNAMVELVGGKAAVAQVYTGAGKKLEFAPHLMVEPSKTQEPEASYYLVTANNWSKEDVMALTSSMEFELASLWFQLTDGKKAAINKLDAVSFFNMIQPVIEGDAEPEGYGVQAIGNVNDGGEILWLNPEAGEVVRVLPALEAICAKEGFGWLVVDQRPKD